jgi:hypothetical protein
MAESQAQSSSDESIARKLHEHLIPARAVVRIAHSLEPPVCLQAMQAILLIYHTVCATLAYRSTNAKRLLISGSYGSTPASSCPLARGAPT